MGQVRRAKLAREHGVVLSTRSQVGDNSAPFEAPGAVTPTRTPTVVGREKETGGLTIDLPVALAKSGGKFVPYINRLERGFGLRVVK